MQRHPLLVCAACWIAGLLCPAGALSPDAWAACALVLLSGCLLLTIKRRCGLACPAVLAAAGFLSAGGLAGSWVTRPDPLSIGGWLERHPDRIREGVEVDGTIRSCTLRAQSLDDAARIELLVACRRMRIGRMEVPVRGDVMLRVPLAEARAVDCPARGDQVRAFARIQSSSGPATGTRTKPPIGMVKSARLMSGRALPHPGIRLHILRAVDALRADLSGRLERAFASNGDGDRAREVCRALLLGERDGIGARDLDALRAAGLSHLLAVSGFNVAVLAGALLLVARVCGAPARGVALACIPVLILYLMLNREEPSVRRAVTMAAAWLTGRALGRHPDPLLTLCLSALIILVPDPGALREAGCQLTFVATLGLILLAPPAGRALKAAPVWARALIVTPVVAWLVTLPHGAILFHRVAPGAIVSNMLAGPLGAAAFIMTLATLALSIVSETAARLAAAGAHLLVDGIFAAARFVDLAGWLSYRRADPSPAGVCLYVTALALLASGAGAGRRRLRAAILAGLAAGGIWIMAPIDSRRPPAGLRVAILDVGQGDAALIETPGGDRILIDAGGQASGRFDVGERIVAPALWSRGIARLTHVVLTHDDADHIGGAAAVVGAFRPSEVWVPRGWERRAGSASYDRLRDAVRRAGSRMRELRAGDDACLRGARIAILHPPAGWPPSSSENESSLVLRAGSGGRAALFMADAGRAAETAVGGAALRADLLKVGHHGSRGSTGPEFLAQVRPRLAAISCGRRNHFGHPHPEVLQRLAGAQVHVCRTDRDGTIEVELLQEATRLDVLCPQLRRR